MVAAGMAGSSTLGEAALRALAWLVPATLVAGVVFAGLVVIAVRLLTIGLREGRHPVRSRVAWQAWTTERLLDASRTILFPLYSSLFTPVWLRLLGAEVGRGVEASTVLLIPSMTTIDDHAFLADDTMVASYELQGGWMRLGPGAHRQAGVPRQLGHRGAGHRLARDALVAVLSVAPAEVEAGHVVARLARRCGCAAPRSRPTRAAPTGRPSACGSPAPCGSSAGSSP